MRPILFTFCLLLITTAWSQEISLPKKAQGIPEALASYHVHNDINQINVNKTKNQFWTLHIDREGASVYSSSTGTDKVSGVTLRTGQPLTVAEVRNGRALVFDMVKESSGFPNISKDAKVIGWVDLSQCFLSSFCLKGEGMLSGKKGQTFSLPRKAILAPKTNLRSGEKEELTFYSLPSANSKPFNSQRFLFQPYYIMKEDNGWFLLSQTDKMSADPIAAKGQMVGWIQASNVVEWGTRTTLEPNWAGQAKSKYSAGVPAYPYDNSGRTAAQKYQADATSGTAMTKFECKGKRMGGEKMRPISLRNDDGIVKALLTLNPGSDINEQLEEEIARIKEQQNNINIVFVLDGTKSMDPYYEPCVVAIEEASRAIRANSSASNIKFGAVIYRDLGHPSDALELLPLSRNIDAVKDFLRGVQCTSIGDRDIPESMFHGLYDGLDQLNLPNNQSNLLIHIGDAGNPIENDPSKQPANGKYRSEKDVANLISDLGMNVVSFQVNRSNHPSYFHFGQQMKSILTQAADNNEVARNARWKGLRNVDSGYEIQTSNSADDAPIIPVFELTLAQNGQTSTRLLQQAIEDAIVSMERMTQERIVWLGKQITSADPNPEFEKWLRNNLEKQGKSNAEINDIIRALTTSGGDIIKTAYTVQDVNWADSKTPPFRSVIYLSEREFRQLMNQMKDLNELSDDTPQEQRNEFIDILITQVLVSAGISPNSLSATQMDNYRDQLETKTMAEIWESLFGYVPNYGVEVVNLPLGRFAKEQPKTNEKGLSTQDWNEFFEAFVGKYKNIQRYSSQRYPFYKLIGADDRYYWIDALEMP